MRISLMLLSLLSGVFVTTAVFANEPQKTPFPTDDAIAFWNFADTNDANGANSQLQVLGNVQLDVPLSEADAQESKLRGGDGRVARFDGTGCLSAEQGANGELNIHGTELTFCVRLRMEPLTGSCPIFSKHGGHQNLGYNLYAMEAYYGAEIGMTGRKVSRDSDVRTPLSTKAPFAEMRSPAEAQTAWHDVICRVNAAKMELFVDGRCVDEDFTLGELNDCPAKVFLGAQDVGDGKPQWGFRGDLDYVAIWNRALTDEEIVTLSGGSERVDSRLRTERGLADESMQYWCPPNEYFVGDCMPFNYDGTFHFMYLLDKNHHGSKNGWGAHQWIQATSRDLIHWTHQPFVVPITEQNEGSICTGSMFFHDGVYYAFYANRSLNAGGVLCCSTSTDGIHFTKQAGPLVVLTEGYAGSLRDPVVFLNPEDGLFHMYATTSYRGRGCWAHIVSKDLKSWKLLDPVYVSENEPECPDYFKWGEFYYVIAGQGIGEYRMAKSPTGPWVLPSKPNKLMQGITRVPKTAPFGENRRIIAAWTAQYGFGGNVVFHELKQDEHGNLSECFVPEMIPATQAPVIEETNLVTQEQLWTNLPQDFRLQAVIEYDPAKRNSLLDYELTLAGSRRVLLQPALERVIAADEIFTQLPATGLFTLDIIVKGDLCDICVNGERTVVQTFQRQNTELKIQDHSQLLLESPELSTTKAAESTLKTRPGYTLRSLKVSPLK